MEKGILIPRKGMAEVIRFLAEEEKVSLGLGTQSLALKADDRYLFIRLLLDKKFPEYRRIIPESLRLPLRHQPPASCSTPSGGLPCCPPSASKA